jgi:hypothetical protein
VVIPCYKTRRNDFRNESENQGKDPDFLITPYPNNPTKPISAESVVDKVYSMLSITVQN